MDLSSRFKITILLNMLPLFPDCKKITLEDKKEIQKYTSNFLPYSDFNFLSLWGYYNTSEDIYVSDLNNNLVVKFKDHSKNTLFYSFLGKNKLVHTISQLLQKATKEGIDTILKFLPEENFSEDLTDKFAIIEDRDNFDYIFSTEELSELKGTRFHNQRHFIGRFLKNHGNSLVKKIDINEKENHNSVIQLFNKWAKDKKKSYEETIHELSALERTIKFAKDFDLFSIAVFDKTKMIGVMIGDLEHKQYCETHFAKGDSDYIGIFYFLYNQFAKKLNEIGYRYINNEQDLGIAGLRHSKMQWNPIRFLKKYNLEKKE